MARPGSTVPGWRSLLESLREVHTDLARLAPYREDGLLPSPCATRVQIEDAELRLGVPLPAAYREFLAHSNGWQRLFDGASLLGTAELFDPSLKCAARSLLRRALPQGVLDDRFLLPFGADPQHTTVFAFDYTRGGNEPAVIGWVQELGLCVASFTTFLEFLLSLSRADLASELERARAATPPIQGSRKSSAA